MYKFNWYKLLPNTHIQYYIQNDLKIQHVALTNICIILQKYDHQQLLCPFFVVEVLVVIADSFQTFQRNLKFEDNLKYRQSQSQHCKMLESQFSSHKSLIRQRILMLQPHDDRYDYDHKRHSGFSDAQKTHRFSGFKEQFL